MNHSAPRLSPLTGLVARTRITTRAAVVAAIALRGTAARFIVTAHHLRIETPRETAHHLRIETPRGTAAGTAVAHHHIKGFVVRFSARTRQDDQFLFLRLFRFLRRA